MIVTLNEIVFYVILIGYIVSILYVICPIKRAISVCPANGQIEKNETLTLRGISIVFVVLHHICQRVSFSHFIAKPFLAGVYLFVGLFFFLSGYGNFISLEKVSKKRSWLTKRLFSLVFFFICGLGVNVLINKDLYISVHEVLNDFYSFTYKPYTLWFFKTLIIMYLLTFIVSTFNFSNILPFYILFFVSVYIVISMILNVPDYWWNSIIAYPLGMIYAKYKKVIQKKSINFFCILLFLVLFILGFRIKYLQPLVVIFFCYMVVMYLYYFKFHSLRCYKYIGGVSLGIYLYHCIFLSILSFPSIVQIYSVGALLVVFCGFGMAVGVNFLYKIILDITKRSKLI